MLQNKMALKKSLLGVLLCIFAAGLIFAQVSSSTEKIINDKLTKAEDYIDNSQFKEAYQQATSALMLSEKEEIPGRVILVAQRAYRKYLENMSKTKNFSDFEDVLARLQTYPKVNEDPQIQKFVKIIQQQQVDIKDAARDAETRKTMESIAAQNQASNEEMVKNITASQQASQEEMVKNITAQQQASQEEMVKTFTSTIDKMDERADLRSKEQHADNKKLVFAIAIGAGVIFTIVFILVFLGIRASARSSAIQAEQLDSTLKLIAGMQQTNNQLLLGGVTDFGGMGLKSAGSSRWGVDALPAPEMTEDEKAELKQLVIDCEKLGSEIDAVTKRKNNSKNVSELVYKLAMKLGLNQNSSMIYFAASMVYDAGFLAVPEELLEAESLTDEQRLQLREHVNKFEQYLGFVPRKYWEIFEEAALYHHENTDGSGYKGLMGADIPQIARLIHVAESYNSLISRRNYKQIMDKETAIQELESKPNLYDIDVVKVLDAIV